MFSNFSYVEEAAKVFRRSTTEKKIVESFHSTKVTDLQIELNKFQDTQFGVTVLLKTALVFCYVQRMDWHTLEVMTFYRSLLTHFTGQSNQCNDGGRYSKAKNF